MKKSRVTIRDTRFDGLGENPTAISIILEAKTYKKLEELIIENAKTLFNPSSWEYLEYAYLNY